MNGQLAVSRAFGDKNLKSHLRSDPDVRNVDIDANTDLLILASDGIWKVTLTAALPKKEMKQKNKNKRTSLSILVRPFI